MVDAQTVGVLVTAASVTVAAIYYIFTLRINMKTQQLALKTQELTLESQKQNVETRQAQLFMQIFDRFMDSDLALNYGKIRYEICPKLNNSPEELSKFIYRNVNEAFNPEVFLPFYQMTLFLDGVGVLVQRNLINIDLVERLFADRIIWLWEMMKPRFDFVRSGQGPQMYSNLEWLYGEMVRRQGKPVAA